MSFIVDTRANSIFYDAAGVKTFLISSKRKIPRSMGRFAWNFRDVTSSLFAFNEGSAVSKWRITLLTFHEGVNYCFPFIKNSIRRFADLIFVFDDEEWKREFEKIDGSAEKICLYEIHHARVNDEYFPSILYFPICWYIGME